MDNYVYAVFLPDLVMFIKIIADNTLPYLVKSVNLAYAQFSLFAIKPRLATVIDVPVPDIKPSRIVPSRHGLRGDN